MYMYNADILRSSFNNFFSKLHWVHDHATWQQVSGNYHHKRVRTDYGKKCCNTLVMLHWLAFLIILKCYHYICFLSCKVATACWVLTFCDTYAMWLVRCLWALTLNWAHFWLLCFVFISFRTHVFALHLCCWIWQSSNVGWAWLSDCFGRLSPNLCCLF